jgi:membrane-bound metal-dependent hydrolase YbcI (DUF457 family)
MSVTEREVPVDNITHGLAGALLAQAGFRQRYGRAATVALIVGAELPDLDFVFDFAGPIVGFQNHRGITHAFVGGCGLALLGAAFAYAVLRYRFYWRVVGLLYLGVLLHIWMDYLTSYGTQIFLPFDAGRYTADAVFIIDYFYTGIIVVALVLIRLVRQQRHARYRMASLIWFLIGMGLWVGTPWFVQQRLLFMALRGLGMHLMLFAGLVALGTHIGRRWHAEHAVVVGRCGIGALAAYMALCIANHAVVMQRFASALTTQHAAVQQVSAIPLPGGPFAWRGIAETPTAYLVSHITLLPPAIVAPQTIAKAPHQAMVQATSDYRLVQIFRDFARFPVIEYEQQGEQQVVRYSDLRFTGYGRERSWFDLEVRFDSAGQVQVIEFLNHLFPPHHPDFR